MGLIDRIKQHRNRRRVGTSLATIYAESASIHVFLLNQKPPVSAGELGLIASWLMKEAKQIADTAKKAEVLNALERFCMQQPETASAIKHKTMASSIEEAAQSTSPERLRLLQEIHSRLGANISDAADTAMLISAFAGHFLLASNIARKIITSNKKLTDWQRKFAMALVEEDESRAIAAEAAENAELK